MELLAFPDEIVVQVVDQIDSEADINRLARTCGRLHGIANRMLYRHNQKYSSCSALIWAAENNIPTILHHAADAGTDIACGDLSILYHAARRGHEEVIRAMLLHCSYGSLSRKNSGEVPILLAGKLDNLRLVKLLLENGADPNQPNFSGQSTLLEVAESCTESMVELLLEYGASPDAGDDVGDKPLKRAAGGGNIPVIKILLDHGADIDANDDRYHTTALQRAVSSSQVAAVKFLCEAGANVTLTNSGGYQALHVVASSNATVEIVDILLDNGAAMDASMPTGSTPLAYAAHHGRSAVVKRLLERGADINDTIGGSKMLYETSKLGHSETVAVLLAHGAHVDDYHFDENKGTALHGAAYLGNLATVEVLVEHGADCNAADGWSQTPLHLAILAGRVDIVKFLVQKGAEIERASRTGNTPLLEAMENGQLGVLECLLGLGASVTACNAAGQGPALVAANAGRGTVLKRILDTGIVDLEKEDANGRTALLLASMRGHRGVVDLIISQEPRPAIDTKDRYGATPFIMAARNHHTSVMCSLLDEDPMLLHNVDGLGRDAFYWASQCRSQDSTYLLMSCAKRAGIDIPERAPHRGKVRFKDWGCYCDVCGRCTTSWPQAAALQCNACGLGGFCCFLICASCQGDGLTCRGEGHKRIPHDCKCVPEMNAQHSQEEEDGDGAEGLLQGVVLTQDQMVVHQTLMAEVAAHGDGHR